MADDSELFRADFASRLTDLLPNDKLDLVMEALALTTAKFEVSQKSTDIIPVGGIPELVKYYIASKRLENLSEITLSCYSTQLKKFFSIVKKPVQNIVTNDIRYYLTECKLSGKASNQTVDGYRRILSAFFGWLFENGCIDRNPCVAVAMIKYQKKERSPLSSYDLEYLRASCVNIREKAIIDFLFSTGLRVSEFVNMKLSDICWGERSVIVHHGKGDKQRTVYFNAESEVSLRKYLSTRNDDCDALFIRTRYGVGKMSVRSVEKLLKTIRERANIEAPVTPHILRHTFATTGLRSGIPIERLQALMGHTKPETTLIYAKTDKTDIQRSHQAAFN